jgi:hypothetical protein
MKNNKTIAIIIQIIGIIFMIGSIIALIVINTSCNSTQSIQENQFYKTRIYCGNLVSISTHEKGSQIEVNYYNKRVDTYWSVKEIVNLPDSGVWCYFKIIYNWMPDGSYVYRTYFTWDGTNQFYQLHQYWATGEPLYISKKLK